MTYTVWSRYYDTRDLRFYWDLSVVEVKVNERVPTWLTVRIARHKSQVVKVQVPPDEDYTARLYEAFARQTSRSSS